MKCRIVINFCRRIPIKFPSLLLSPFFIMAVALVSSAIETFQQCNNFSLHQFCKYWLTLQEHNNKNQLVVNWLLISPKHVTCWGNICCKQISSKTRQDRIIFGRGTLKIFQPDRIFWRFIEILFWSISKYFWKTKRHVLR